MLYPDGSEIRLGDVVNTEGGVEAVVVGLIQQSAYTAPLRGADWDYLVEGVLVMAGDAGLIHYRAPEPSWSLLSRS